jgi:tetratricopeptide (TPR) repeat protein
LPPAYTTAPGHLGLARDRRVLGGLLTPEALFLDATHALAAGALSTKPFSGEMIRQLRDDARDIIAEEPDGKAEEVRELRLDLALVDAEDGRFEDALDALARLAAERPSDPRPRICASVISCFVGLVEEGEQWIAAIPVHVCQENRVYFKRAVKAATLGGAPGAVAGIDSLDCLVALTAFEAISSGLEAKYLDGDISLLKKMVFGALLWRLVAKELKGQVSGEASPPRCDRKEPLFPGLRGSCVEASQALQSAVLLRAHPLSGDRLRNARRAAERDLARAVGEGDGPAAADLRLLLALFAARDGRFDDALQLYEEVARDDRADPRPHGLAFVLCGVVGLRNEFHRWMTNNEGFLCLAHVPAEQIALQDEVVVAAALGGALYENAEDDSMPSSVKRMTRLAVCCAWRRADAGLATALLREDISIVKKMQVRAARVFLRAGTRSVLKGMDAKVLEKLQEEHDNREEV